MTTMLGMAIRKCVERWRNPLMLAVPESANATLHAAMREPGTRIYGHRGTIHGTESLSVEVDASGHVVSVWFRCQALPFEQTIVSRDRALDMAESYHRAMPRLVAVELIDR